MGRILKIWMFVSFVLLIAVALSTQHNLYQAEAMIFTFIWLFIALLVIILLKYFRKKR